MNFAAHSPQLMPAESGAPRRGEKNGKKQPMDRTEMSNASENGSQHHNGSPHHLDVALGSRIRLRRRELGRSQEQLAREVGITFQQVQKYEHGTNRVSFSRLVEIARALDCGVTDLMGDLDSKETSPLFSRHVVRLNEPGAAELLEAYASIGSSKHRRAILNLARQLADGSPANGFRIDEDETD
jgi:transcriptional regulator with XRE-family HTH domain